MRFDPRAGITDLRKDETGRRRRGRIGQEAVRCDLGPVLDLSAAGMRILCRRVPKGEIATRIIGLGTEISVCARVAWSRKLGLFRHEAGFEFIDLTPEIVEKITALGMMNRDRRMIHRPDSRTG